MRVLGLDPGSRTTGWGFLDGEVHGPCAATWGCLRGRRGSPRAAVLAGLAAELEVLLSELEPQVVAVETPFAARFPKAALALAETRGALLAALGRWGGPVVDYEPTRVKAAIVGYGRAEKQQVAFMVRQQLGIATELPTDAADALAVALCHLRQVSGGRLDAVTRAV